MLVEIFSSFASTPHGWWYGFFKDFAGPIATVIASGTAAWLTWVFQRRNLEIQNNQAEISKNKLKLDLYDKRMEVFAALGKLLIPDFGNDAERYELSKKAYKAEFLFGEDVVLFVKQAVKRTDEYYHDMALIKDYRSSGDVELIRPLHQRQSVLRNGMFASQQELTLIFRPYLSFENIK